MVDTSQPVFDVDETGQFWKRTSARTYISKEEKCAPGFKAAKDHMTLLLGGNAATQKLIFPLFGTPTKRPGSLE